MNSVPEGQFVLAPDRSRLGFRAKAFLLLPVNGNLHAKSGELEIADGAMSATGVAAAGSVSTGIGLRDKHLRHHHYLSATDYPDVTLEMSRALAGTGSVTAILSVRGNSVEVPLTIDRLDGIGTDLLLEAHGTFDRVPIGMLPPLAGVSRQIHLDLDLVFTTRI